VRETRSFHRKRTNRVACLVAIRSADLVAMSTHLSWIENEIDCLGSFFYRIDCDRVRFAGRPCLVHVNHMSIPWRILIRREHIEWLSSAVNQSQYTLFTHSSSPEAIVQSHDVQQLTVLVEPLVVLNKELRILIHECRAAAVIDSFGCQSATFVGKYPTMSIQVRIDIDTTCSFDSNEMRPLV
jgi:hypothetical protein